MFPNIEFFCFLKFFLLDKVWATAQNMPHFNLTHLQEIMCVFPTSIFFKFSAILHNFSHIYAIFFKGLCCQPPTLIWGHFILFWVFCRESVCVSNQDFLCVCVLWKKFIVPHFGDFFLMSWCASPFFFVNPYPSHSLEEAYWLTEVAEKAVTQNGLKWRWLINHWLRVSPHSFQTSFFSENVSEFPWFSWSWNTRHYQKSLFAIDVIPFFWLLVFGH